MTDGGRGSRERSGRDIEVTVNGYSKQLFQGKNLKNERLQKEAVERLSKDRGCGS